MQIMGPNARQKYIMFEFMFARVCSCVALETWNHSTSTSTSTSRAAAAWKEQQQQHSLLADPCATER